MDWCNALAERWLKCGSSNASGQALVPSNKYFQIGRDGIQMFSANCPSHVPLTKISCCNSDGDLLQISCEQMDDWKIPAEGNLILDFVSIKRPALDDKRLTDEEFHNVWMRLASDKHVGSTELMMTDHWKLDLLHVLCWDNYFNSEQARSTVECISYNDDKVEAAVTVSAPPAWAHFYWKRSKVQKSMLPACCRIPRAWAMRQVIRKPAFVIILSNSWVLFFQARCNEHAIFTTANDRLKCNCLVGLSHEVSAAFLAVAFTSTCILHAMT